MPLDSGTAVGPYDVIAAVGAGGMGEVYRARDRRLGREVALKVLASSKLANNDRKQRFIQEAKTASSLNHPNIVTIYDIGSDNGVDYIAMEYVRGRTLDQIIPEKGLRLNETLRLAIAIADALARAHSAGIVHRDLKPGNVMVTEDGHVKLLDFGLAKLVDSGVSDVDNTMSIAPAHTIEGMILGTVSYMSPEQARGLAVDARSDIFSFGVLVYEMITGRRAFRSDSPIATLSAILTEDPVRISAVTADIPPELERVISRCMKKEPDKRWQNMKDVKVALQELKEESDSGTLIASRVHLPPVKKGRNPVLIALLTACVVLLVAGGTAVMLTRSRAPKPAADVAETWAEEQQAKPSSAAGSAAAADGTLTNDSIIELVNGNVSLPVIAGHIKNSKTNFNLSTAEVVRLSKAGVPDAVIEMMRNPRALARVDASRTITPNSLPADNPAPPVPPAHVAPVPPAPAALVTIPDAAKVTLVIAPDAFAKDAAAGDTVRFTVRDNVTVGDRLVVAKGASATGVITETERRRIFGRGKLMMKFNEVVAVDGQRLRLRPTPIAESAERSIPLTKSPAELVMGIPVFISGPAEVHGTQLQ